MLRSLLVIFFGILCMASPVWAADSKGDRISGPAGTLIADATAESSGDIEEQVVKPDRAPNNFARGPRVERVRSISAAPTNPNRANRLSAAPARGTGAPTPSNPNSGSGRSAVPRAPSVGTGVSVPSNPNNR
jgi:hypothetical protein